MTNSKYHFKCPRCDVSMGVANAPIGGPPTCANYKGHHSKKEYLMEFDTSRSTEEEPNPYPKSKKVYYK